MSVHPIRLTAEYGGVALGLGAPRPRLSWHLDATPGDTQRGYRITARGDGPPLDSGPVDSRESTWIPWPFPPLSSRQRLEVQVGAWGRAGPRETAWSEPLALEAGLLLPGDWHVPMVVADPLRPDDDGPRPAFLARAEFAAPDQVHRARLYMTAHGVYTAEVNGSPASDDVLDPGWTSYRHRVIARTYDIGHLVRPGLNAIGIWLADGWYRGRLGFSGGVRDVYGKALAFLAQVEITTPDGLVLATGPQTPWRVTPSPIVAAGLYEGETYDARLECPGWSLPGFDDISWREAQQEPNNAIVRTVVPPTLAPIRVIETIEPRTREVQPSGRIRFDFGQNLSGRLTATVRTADGGVVRLHHAEALENGDLATRPLRAATSVDSLILAGNGVRRHTPRFTLHGFRYAEAETSTPAIAVEEVKAEVIHTDMDRTGWFACSNEMLNRLHENVVWSMRANFASLPTDCPQRDERLGWTGDIQVFAPTALYLYDCAGLLVNWLADLAAEQREFATVPNFVPWIECGFPDDPAAAWGDAAVIVPWKIGRAHV
jgi:alpha-L-rhamnosidase